MMMTIPLDLYPVQPSWLPDCLRGPTHIWQRRDDVENYHGEPFDVWVCLVCCKLRPLVLEAPRCPLG